MNKPIRPSVGTSTASVRHAERRPGGAAKAEQARADTTVQAPQKKGLDAVVDQPLEVRPSQHRDSGLQSRAPRKSDLDSSAVAAHLREQHWFAEGDKPVRAVEILSEQDVETSDKSARHALVGVQVQFEDGTKERYLAPLRIDGNGGLSDGLQSAAMKQALVEAVASGEQFEHIVKDAVTRPAARSARRRPAAATGQKGWLGAAQLVHGQRTQQAGKASGEVLKGGAYDAKAEVGALSRAVYDGEKNAWSPLLDKGYTTRERFEFVVEQARKCSPENADALVVEFFKNVHQTLESQPASVRAFHDALKSRPKFGPVFYGYVQFAGVPDSERAAAAKKGEVAQATFDDLIPMLDIIQGKQKGAGALGSMVRGGDEKPAGLGFRDVELLPFFLSPQKDGGYDITDHAEVAPELGGNAAFQRFMKEAVDRGVRVTADLVGNHVAADHQWVKALEQGDTSMLSRFVVWDDAVKIGERTLDEKIFNVFLHTKGEHAGKISHVWQIFPDNNPDTFIEAKSGDKKHNVFASFMNPYQWDINAADPQVLSYYLDVIGHFANLGQMGTRMDAIIHMGKEPGTFNINLPQSQAFMQLAKSFSSHVSPGHAFLPEANLPWEEAKRDWLEPERVFAGKVENLAGDALISFDVHRAIWDSLLKNDKEAWMTAQASLGELPPHKSLMVYLGLHDENLIEDPKLRQELIDKGFKDFAGRGVGDSPAALLEGDADRLAMAHVLLYSSKGHPAVYYRNLVGAPNDQSYFETKKDQRLRAQEEAGDAPNVAKATDTRDLNRGPVFLSDYERALKEEYKPAVTIRALNSLWDKHGSVRSNQIEEVKNPDAGVVSFARRATETSDPPLLQLINLTAEKKTVVVDLADLERQLGWSQVTPGSLRDLLQEEMTGAAAPMSFSIEDGKLKLELAPYDAVYLERAEDQA